VLTGIDDAFIELLVTGTVEHRVRRVHEMEAPDAMLRELWEVPLTTEAAAARSSNPLSCAVSLPSNPEHVGQCL
jgi:hypothetical protein